MDIKHSLFLLRLRFKIWFRKVFQLAPVQVLRRGFLYLALGPSVYYYMVRSLQADKRAPVAKQIDIVVRKDGVEKRIEADWNKDLARLVRDVNAPHV
jgi:hypothetical protein